MNARLPALRTVVLDATDARAVAELYRELLGYSYRAGDEPPAPGEPDPGGEDWLVLTDRKGDARLAIQQVADLAAATWPDPAVPQQLHLDLYVFADPAGHPFCIFVSPTDRPASHDRFWDGTGRHGYGLRDVR